MNLSNILDQTADHLETIDWKKIGIKIIEIWDRFFKIIVITMILTYLGGKSLGHWVHRTNDFLAANWVRLIVPPTPVMEEEEIPLPAPLEDPWASPIEVELMLPLEPLAILFTAPMMLAAAQAPVALLAAGQELIQQPPPAATNGRRKRERSTQTQVAATAPRRHREPSAHKNRACQTA